MDSIIISNNKNKDDSSNSSKYSQLNKINLQWRELLLNSSIDIFNIANKNFSSIDDFYEKSPNLRIFLAYQPHTHYNIRILKNNEENVIE